MRKNSFKGYKLDFTKPALKDLKKIDQKIAETIVEKFEDLVAGKENIDFTKLETPNDITYRLRYGRYRAICEIHKNVITISIVSVDHRRESYRDY
jgi:mRNA-degrading endonuclease RelE of RelBE toxin-antitoxin system